MVFGLRTVGFFFVVRRGVRGCLGYGGGGGWVRGFEVRVEGCGFFFYCFGFVRVLLFLGSSTVFLF